MGTAIHNYINYLRPSLKNLSGSLIKRFDSLSGTIKPYVQDQNERLKEFHAAISEKEPDPKDVLTKGYSFVQSLNDTKQFSLKSLKDKFIDIIISDSSAQTKVKEIFDLLEPSIKRLESISGSALASKLPGPRITHSY